MDTIYLGVICDHIPLAPPTNISILLCFHTFLNLAILDAIRCYLYCAVNIRIIRNRYLKFLGTVSTSVFLKMACDKISKRFLIFLMLCMVLILGNFVRSNMSLVILAMTKPLINSTAEVPDYGPRYEWTSYEQSLIIGSYFWGQIVMVLCSGILAGRYGPRYFVGIGILTSMILCILAPLSANFLWLLIALNFLIGFSMGTFPNGTQALISNWAPPEEKGKFQSTVMANGFGVLINWSMSGVIIKRFGWHYAFYAVGIILGMCAVVWFIAVYDSPEVHPRITQSEREFILSKLNKLNTTNTKTMKPWPPFRSILLSVPFWALVCYHFGNMYATYFFMTAIPKFLTACKRLSSIPYLIRFPIAIAFGSFSDLISKRKLVETSVLRKGFSIFSHFIPAGCLIGLHFAGSNTYGCVALVTIALGTGSAISVTSMMNPHDLSPNFAVTIFGFMHTIASTPGFLSPMLVAYFTREKDTEDEWYYIFLTGAVIMTCSATIFILLGSVRVQKWNKIEAENDVEKEEYLLRIKE